MPENEASPLAAHRLIGRVCIELGLTKAAFQDVAESLERLVESLLAEADLHAAGALRAANVLETCLKQRHQLKAARASHAGSFRRAITRPLFLIGLPGTGTTLLHELLNQDPDNRCPRLWELSYPLPPPEPSSYQDNPRIAQTEYDLARVFAAQPILRQVQLLHAQEAAECSPVFNRSLLSPQFLMHYHVPGYAEWFWQQPIDHAYRWYRDELLLLQTNVLGNWVLRSPFHQWGIASLRAEFPDAVLVHTHREPMDVLTSGASYVETLRRGHSDRVEPLYCGQDWCAMVQKYATRLEQWHATATQADRDSVVDVSWRKLAADPIGTATAIYKAAGRKLGLETRMRMQAWLKNNPRHTAAESHRDAARFGLDATAARQAVGAYGERCKAYF
jgi:hypothetical protein